MTNETDLPPPAMGMAAKGDMVGDCDRAALPLSGDALPENDLSMLCRDLADAMYQPVAGPDMLRRQAYLLDQIIYALMDKHVNARIESGAYLTDWLDMIMRVQRQCMDTVKTLEAADYMRALTTKRPPVIPPPRDHGKQKEGFE